MSETTGRVAPPPVDANTRVAFAGVSFPYRHYALALLTGVYVLNYLDRQILSILLEPIKNEFGVSDTVLGFLSGFAFALFYATLGIPIAWLADRYNRKRIIVVSLTIFSGMTALCGLAVQFWQLALARIGVGIGEAGTSPPSHSILADLYPPQQRATALAIFSMGVNLGIMIGFFAGGWIAEVYGWRIAFITAGLPGLLIALIVVMTLREPPRGLSEPVKHDDASPKPAAWDVMRFMWSQKAWRYLLIACCINVFLGYGMVIWTPAFLMRSHEMSIGNVGTILALMQGLLGGLGAFAGGFFTDYMAKKDVRWSTWIPGLSIVVSLPLLALFWVIEPTWLAFVIYILPAFLGTVYLGPTFALTQSLVPVGMRAMAAAILLFIINIIGLGFGPQAVGFVSDLLNPMFGDDSLRYALLAGTPIGILVGVFYWVSAKYLKADLARVQLMAEGPQRGEVTG